MSVILNFIMLKMESISRTLSARGFDEPFSGVVRKIMRT